MHLFIVLHAVPTPMLTISPSGPIQGAMVGSPQVISCTVSTVSGVESSLVMVSWMGPGGNITNDSRVTISQTTFSGNNYTRNLEFEYLAEGDEGNYSCNVMIPDSSESQSVEIQSLTGKQQFQYYIFTGLNYCSILQCTTYYALHIITMCMHKINLLIFYS